PGERRRGIARALVEAGLAAASRAGAAVCHLEVRTTNAGAIAFYETLGFTAVGSRKGYYRDGTDALVLAKEL
ncbi:MAG TPA: ribosomal-protein-alanine N-acetyltransferase, partial [Acidobacteria bacterium]|nr:ribosomal-protein-alanine N-acetyltransferase [Acidobacteriota bacterium]